MHEQPLRVPDRLDLPDDHHRWRCGACGNLTRFDVVRTAKTQEYWHVDLGGRAQVEESTTVMSCVDSVSCRWCGRNDAISLVDRPESSES